LETLKSDNTSDPEHDALSRERERMLRKALTGLRRVYREAVILRDIEGFAYEEIAIALDISVEQLNRVWREVVRNSGENWKDLCN
jgi:DNA-directed RNA polymerase specialized sigma24 family protein